MNSVNAPCFSWPFTYTVCPGREHTCVGGSSSSATVTAPQVLTFLTWASPYCGPVYVAILSLSLPVGEQRKHAQVL